MAVMSLGSTLSVPPLLCLCFLALVSSSSSSMANSDFDFVKNVGLREYERRIGIFVIVGNEKLEEIKRRED